MTQHDTPDDAAGAFPADDPIGAAADTSAGPGLFDDAAMIAEIDRRAWADIAAGRLLGHEAVLVWLATWGLDRPPAGPLSAAS